MPASSAGCPGRCIGLPEPIFVIASGESPSVCSGRMTRERTASTIRGPSAPIARPWYTFSISGSTGMPCALAEWNVRSVFKELLMSAFFSGNRRVPAAQNEPNLVYAPGSPERAEIKARLKAMSAAITAAGSA